MRASPNFRPRDEPPGRTVLCPPITRVSTARTGVTRPTKCDLSPAARCQQAFVKFSSVAPSLTIRRPLVVFVLTLYGSLVGSVRRKHGVCVSDRAGHRRSINAIGDVQFGGGELSGQDEVRIGFFPVPMGIPNMVNNSAGWQTGGMACHPARLKLMPASGPPPRRRGRTRR